MSHSVAFLLIFLFATAVGFTSGTIPPPSVDDVLLFHSHIDSVSLLFGNAENGNNLARRATAWPAIPSTIPLSSRPTFHPFPDDERLQSAIATDPFGFEFSEPHHGSLHDIMDPSRATSKAYVVNSHAFEPLSTHHHHAHNYTNARTTLKTSVRFFQGTVFLDLIDGVIVESVRRRKFEEANFIQLIVRLTTSESINLMKSDWMPGSRFLFTDDSEDEDAIMGLVLRRWLVEETEDPEGNENEMVMGFALTEFKDVHQFVASMDVDLDHWPGDEDKIAEIQKRTVQIMSSSGRRESSGVSLTKRFRLFDYNYNYNLETQKSLRPIPLFNYQNGSWTLKVECEDCFFYFHSGVIFSASVSILPLAVTGFKVALTGDSKAQIATLWKAQYHSKWEKEGTMLPEILVGTIVIPIYPPLVPGIPIDFKLRVDWEMSFELDITLQIVHSMSAFATGEIGFRYAKGATDNGLYTTFKPGYEFERPKVSATGVATLEAHVKPVLAVVLFKTVLRFEFFLDPYAGIVLNASLTERIATVDFFWGLDFGVTIGKVDFWFVSTGFGGLLPYTKEWPIVKKKTVPCVFGWCLNGNKVAQVDDNLDPFQFAPPPDSNVDYVSGSVVKMPYGKKTQVISGAPPGIVWQYWGSDTSARLCQITIGVWGKVGVRTGYSASTMGQMVLIETVTDFYVNAPAGYSCGVYVITAAGAQYDVAIIPLETGIPTNTLSSSISVGSDSSHGFFYSSLPPADRFVMSTVRGGGSSVMVSATFIVIDTQSSSSLCWAFNQRFSFWAHAFPSLRSRWGLLSRGGCPTRVE